MVHTDTTVAGIRLSNPMMLASGILDENGYTMLEILKKGAAAVVTKSIGTSERTGYKPPVVVPIQGGLLNAIGLANPGIKNFRGEMEIALRGNKPVVGSIFGATADEFLQLALDMEEYGATAVELNLSCPHVAGYGTEVGSDPQLVEDIVTALKSKLKIPVFAKLSPNVTNIVDIANAAHRADALVLINTVRAMSIDIHARKAVLTNRYGGLSGPAIKNVGVRYVYEVKKETGKEIIGVGGIENANDLVEYVMAGASAVQIGTALYTQGKDIFSRIEANLEKFMEAEGFNRISEMIGVAVE